MDSKTINHNFQKNIMVGRKIPHSISQPVVFFENGNYYLAAFIFFYTKNDIENGKIDRPAMWVIADIETGDIIREYETKEREFSDAVYDVKYNIRADRTYDTSEEYYDRAFSLLDVVREKIIRNGEFCKEEYQQYLNMILANTPLSYQRFYINLSI